MIFATVGTNEAPFDRLLRPLMVLGPDESVLVQYGHSQKLHPPHAEAVPFLTFDEVVDAMRRARVVVTHGGVGSIMVALASGKRAIVVPRRKKYGEAVDDHQLQVARRFEHAGLVTLVESPERVPGVLLDHASDATFPAPHASERLTTEIRTFLKDAISPARASSE